MSGDLEKSFREQSLAVFPDQNDTENLLNT